MKVALSIAAVLLAVTLVRANPANPCTAVNQMYPYPSDTTKFIHCTSATTYEVMSCAPGTVWDQSQQLCDHGPNVPANPTAAPTAAPTAPTAAPTAAPASFVCSVGAFLEDACELNVFYMCVPTADSNGKWQRMLCPATLIFDPAISVCAVNGVNGFSRTPVCFGVVPPNCGNFVHGTYFPDLCIYSKFYRCDNGVTHTFTCPGGLEFDRNENVCNWPSAAANPPVPAYC